jgi:hypothetical protein
MPKTGELVRVLAGWNRNTTAMVVDVSPPSVKLVNYCGQIFFLRERHIVPAPRWKGRQAQGRGQS